MKPESNRLISGDKQFFSDIIEIIRSGRNTVYRVVNSTMVETYWQIGQRIVEQEQHGKERAAYGEQLLKSLSSILTETFGKGFDETNLQKIRQFYLVFSIRDSLRLELKAELARRKPQGVDDRLKAGGARNEAGEKKKVDEGYKR